MTSADEKMLAEAFANVQSFGTPMFAAVLMQYGPEALQWHPRTLLLEIEDDFRIKLPQGNFDRLMAMITVVTTDLFWQDLPVFNTVCHVLAGGGVTDEFNPVDTYDIAWGLTEASLADPGQESHLPNLSEEIKGYILEVCQENGISSPPDILAEALGDMSGTQPGMNFTDDPDMFAANWYTQKTNSIDLQKAISEGILELLTQMGRLPIPSLAKTELLQKKQKVTQRLRSLQEEEANLASR